MLTQNILANVRARIGIALAYLIFYRIKIKIMNEDTYLIHHLLPSFLAGGVLMKIYLSFIIVDIFLN